VELREVILVAFYRDLRKERNSSIEICYPGIVIQLRVYDLILDYHDELIYLKAKFVSNPRSYLAKRVMIEDFAVSDLTFLWVKPIVDLDLCGLHYAN